MNRLAYSAVVDASAAIARTRAEGDLTYIAGGTDVLQLMQEGVLRPRELLDINGLSMARISQQVDGVRIGALCRLNDVADDPLIRDKFAVLAEALAQTASPQVRNMATIGGNLLQRTRCPYFRDVVTPCNKRQLGTGCSALEGQNRLHAILGASAHCIAVHPSDLAVALLALDAEVLVQRHGGERTIPLERFYRLPGDTPHIETDLEPGDLITGVWIPIEAAGRRSHYFKVRDRASFEWALASCAVSIGLDDTSVLVARIAVGGVATKPWRLHQVEEALVGRPLDSATISHAAQLATRGAQIRTHNAYKVPLLQATVARALERIGHAS